MKALQAFIKRNNSNGDRAIVQGLIVAEDDSFVEMACRAYIIVAVELFVKFSSLEGMHYRVWYSRASMIKLLISKMQYVLYILYSNTVELNTSYY
jgi:hypothetical protein